MAKLARPTVVTALQRLKPKRWVTREVLQCPTGYDCIVAKDKETGGHSKEPCDPPARTWDDAGKGSDRITLRPAADS